MAIPGVSDWVMGIIKRGYTLQFARRPPWFGGVVSTSVQRSTAHVLRTEVISLPAKGAMETISPAQSESAFYSRYFIVPKKDGGLRLIFDLNPFMKWPFRMITSKQILSQICPGDWFFWLDLKGTYFHIQITPHHRLFLRFASHHIRSHQLPGKAGSMFGPSHLSARPEGTSSLSPLGQYDGGVLHKLPGWSFLEEPLYSSRAPLEVGSAQLVLAESNACAGQTEPGSRHAISEQCPLRWVDAPPTNGSGNMGNLQQTRGRTLCLRR